MLLLLLVLLMMMSAHCMWAFSCVVGVHFFFQYCFKHFFLYNILLLLLDFLLLLFNSFFVLLDFYCEAPTHRWWAHVHWWAQQICSVYMYICLFVYVYLCICSFCYWLFAGEIVRWWRQQLFSGVKCFLVFWYARGGQKASENLFSHIPLPLGRLRGDGRICVWWTQSP